MGSPSFQSLAWAGVEAETAPIRERLTEEAEQLQRLSTGAQQRDRMLAVKAGVSSPLPQPGHDGPKVLDPTSPMVSRK